MEGRLKSAKMYCTLLIQTARASFLVQMQNSKRLMRRAASDAVVRSVVIVLLDSAADRLPRFPHVAIFRRPDSFLIPAAMEPFDVAVASRVRIRRSPMPNAQSVAQPLANAQRVRHPAMQIQMQKQNESTATSTA